MSDCTVLGDSAIHALLMDQTRSEIHTFLSKVSTALRQIAVGGERASQPTPAVINRPDGRKNLFRTFTSPSGVGCKIIVDPSKALASQSATLPLAERNRLMGLHGVLVLCDENGFPAGFLNAEEITGYRTTLSALILWVRRRDSANIVIFGAGKQALWHSRLILALRGDEVKRITYVNRSAERTRELVGQIREENEARWKAEVSFEIVQPGDEEKVRSVVGEADAVFCTTPSMEVLFPATLLQERKLKGCYVSAIGSWQASMIELDPELFRFVADMDRSNGVVIVDDRKECLENTGEGTRSGLTDDQVAEVGEILDLLDKPQEKLSADTKECLETGFVVYKSVGVSLTDLAAGQAVLALAGQKGVGVTVHDF